MNISEKNNNLENIICKIKNMKRLSNVELEFIKKKITPSQKYELIILYNDIAITRYNMLLLSK